MYEDGEFTEGNDIKPVKSQATVQKFKTTERLQTFDNYTKRMQYNNLYFGRDRKQDSSLKSVLFKQKQKLCGESKTMRSSAPLVYHSSYVNTSSSIVNISKIYHNEPPQICNDQPERTEQEVDSEQVIELPILCRQCNNDSELPTRTPDERQKIRSQQHSSSLNRKTVKEHSETNANRDYSILESYHAADLGVDRQEGANHPRAMLLFSNDHEYSYDVPLLLIVTTL